MFEDETEEVWPRSKAQENGRHDPRMPSGGKP